MLNNLNPDQHKALPRPRQVKSSAARQGVYCYCKYLPVTAWSSAVRLVNSAISTSWPSKKRHSCQRTFQLHQVPQSRSNSSHSQHAAQTPSDPPPRLSSTQNCVAAYVCARGSIRARRHTNSYYVRRAFRNDRLGLYDPIL
jgi:hypothetical protein